MKRRLILLLFCIASLSGAAQTIGVDEEMEYLVGVVRLLGKQDEASYLEACRLLSQDMKWTPMNETGAFQPGECSPSEKVPGFKLNRALSQVAGNRKYVSTHGDMLNGEDERYDYSLYERSVHAGQTVSYQLKGREGNQLFILIPFTAGQGLSANLSLGEGEPVPFVDSGDGILVAKVQCPALKRDQTLSLTVTGGKENQAFVILNHNTRQR